MNGFELFLLKSSVVVAVHYVVYYFLLRNANHFTLNRYIILSCLISALVLPFIRISGSVAEVVNFVHASFPSILEEVDPVVSVVEGKSISIPTAIYFIGVLLLTLRFATGLARLTYIYIKSPKYNYSGFTVVATEENTGPFTFFNLLFINSAYFSQEPRQELIIHELAHKKQYHSLDVLFAELVTVAMWFNPFVWLFNRALRTEHEFYADNQVLKQGYNSVEYSKLLFGLSVGLKYSLVHNFNVSQIIKRVKMMNQEKVNTENVSVYFRAVTLMLVTGMAMLYVFQANGQGNTVPDVMPEYVEGRTAMYDVVAKQVKYPLSARRSQTQGEVYISFTVGVNGNLSDVKAVEKQAIVNAIDGVVVVAYGDVEERDVVQVEMGVLEEEAVRVVSMLKSFHPGKVEGNPVSVELTMPITFKLN